MAAVGIIFQRCHEDPNAPLLGATNQLIKLSIYPSTVNLYPKEQVVLTHYKMTERHKVEPGVILASNKSAKCLYSFCN